MENTVGLFSLNIGDRFILSDKKYTIDDDNAFVCFANTTKDRDQIIKAINSHEKLVEALENLREELDEDHIHDREDCTGDCPICVIDEALEAEKKE